MSDQFVGEIRLFAGSFAPKDFAFCNGQLLAIPQYTALFSLLGTMYGGNGTTNFALPNLLGCTPMHFNRDSTPGRSVRSQGDQVGTPVTTLSRSQLPSHNHFVTAVSAAANQTEPNPNSFFGSSPGGRGQQGPPEYAGAGVAAIPIHPQTVVDVGGGQPIDIHQPFLGLNFIIALVGAFPPRQ